MGTARRNRGRLALLLLASLLGACGGGDGPALPDIILLVSHGHAGAELRLEGSIGLETRSLDELASRGVRFRQAFTAEPHAEGAWAALLSGRMPHQAEASPELPGLPDRLAEAGYNTMFFGSWPFSGSPEDRGFREFSEPKDDELTTRLVLDRISKEGEAGERKPYFMVVFWGRPGERRGNVPPTAQPPENLDDDLRSKPLPQRLYLEAEGEMVVGNPQAAWRKHIEQHWEHIRAIDRNVGRIVEETDRFSPGAVLIYTSDHGYLAGSHGYTTTAPAMYEEQVWVPLIWRSPSRWRTGISTALVSSTDIAATLCELVDAPPPEDYVGDSLLPILTGTDDRVRDRQAVFAESEGPSPWSVPVRMVREEEWKYVRYRDHGEELYDLEGDPFETRNLAKNKRHERTRRRLSETLDRWLAYTVDPFVRLESADVLGQPLSRVSVKQRARRGAKRPDIILIVADDQGWGDFGFMQHPTIETPHLDRLVAGGALFPNGYVSAPLDRPSFASILTGLFPQQHGLRTNEAPDEAQREAMTAAFRETEALPEFLDRRGYISFQTGKFWEGHFSNAGFTEGMTEGGREGGSGLSIGRLTLQPIYDFIERSGAKPTFLLYAPLLPHEPHTAPWRHLKHYVGRGLDDPTARYFATCSWLDETIGQLVNHLEEQGTLENTLILFAVDNGWVSPLAEAEEASATFRERSKLSPYESGIRTPILLSWGARIRPAVYPDLASTVDLVPTLLAAVDMRAPAPLLGRSLLERALGGPPIARGAVYGEVHAQTPSDPSDPCSSLTHIWIRRGRWKLIQPQGPGFAELYDLVDDPDEKLDLSSRRPDLVEDLTVLLEAWWERL